MHFADRLAEIIKKKQTPLCVGLDPRWESLPKELRDRHGNQGTEGIAKAFEEFSLEVLDIVAPIVGVVKPQSAFFEQLGPHGMVALRKILLRAKELGLITIMDNKRGDISTTATAYAEAIFGPASGTYDQAGWPADSMTINPYLGQDAVEPFLKAARARNGGLFVLVRTSNPGAKLFQDLICEGKPVYHHVARALAKWNDGHLGECGLGDAGAVVGATYPAEAHALRKEFPQLWFLVPGYGAQGGGVDEVRPSFREDGLGAIVNSSRGVLFPTNPEDLNWKQSILHAAKTSAQALGSLLKP